MDSLSDPRIVQIHLKKSKCEQFGSGSDIVVGVTGAVIFQVSAMRGYLEMRGTQPGPFFLDSAGRTVTKPLIGCTGSRKCWHPLASRLTNMLYAGHSFRIGAATTAALVGIEDSMIQTLGRWHNAAFLQYIRTPKEHLATWPAHGTTRDSSASGGLPLGPKLHCLAAPHNSPQS